MIQLTELHFREPPRCDYGAIKRRVQEILREEVDAVAPRENEKAFIIFHKNHTTVFAEGRLPAQTAILSTDERPKFERYSSEIGQSWNCPEAADRIRESNFTLLVTEMMSRSLSPQDRYRLFHGGLQAVVELTEPLALVFKHSEQVILPSSYLDSCPPSPELRPGSINVRLFNITGTDGDLIMDTRGLSEVGLHDLQCHFRGLEANDVFHVLYNTAIYIVEHGPVIESGQTLCGIAPDSKWRCQFEDSLLEPKRKLLDINPGAPHAAGNR
jgi:hypothetical protein